jgi:hypothetical protein
MKKITPYFLRMLVAFLLIQGIGIEKLAAQLNVSKQHFYNEKQSSRSLEKIKPNARQHSVQKRGNGTSVLCATDTSTYADIGSSLDYRLVFLGNGQNLGMFFNAPQEITLNGFRFFGFLPYDTAAKVTQTQVVAKIYAAGLDSLPVGNPLDTLLISIDTIQGALNFENTRYDVVFNTPLKLQSNYVITLENNNPNSAYAANIVTNSWFTRDGLGLNLAKVQLNNRWYNAQDINLDGYLFDANFLIYPFVEYTLSADFKSPDNCYARLDTLRFENQYKKSVLSSPFYNEYAHYESTGFGSWCHTWSYNDTAIQESEFHGTYKPSDWYNVRAKLVSYMVPYSRNVDFCFDSSETTVHFKPQAPVLTDNQGCIGANENLELVAHPELNYAWYIDSVQGNFFNSGSSYQINNFNKTTTYYITAENASNATCKIERSPVTFNVNEYPVRLVLYADSLNLCTGAFAVLEGSADIGTVHWYSSLTGGTPLHKGDIYQTAALNQNATFYAEGNNNGCALKAARSKVVVKVSSNFAPSIPTVSGTTEVCVPEFQSKSVVLSATPSSGSSLRWFTNPTTSNVASTNSNFTVDVFNRGDVYVYVQSWNGACGSSKLPVKVSGHRAPKLLETRTEEICFGDTAKLSAFGNWGQVEWFYDSLPGTQPIAQGNFVNVFLKDSGANKVFIKLKEGSCYNDTWYSVKTVVRPTLVPQNIISDSVCRGSSALIALKNVHRELSLSWYESPTSREVISGDSTLNLGVILNPTTRYLETDYRGCRSKRIPITVGVLHKPVAGFRVTYPTEGSVFCQPINLNNMNVNWNFGNGATSQDTTPTYSYLSTGAYKITMFANSTRSKCADTAYADVNVVVNRNSLLNKMAVVFPNPVSAGGVLNVTGLEGSGFSTWYLFDLSGRLMYKGDLKAALESRSLQLSIPEGAPSGWYLLQCEGMQGSYSQWLQITK